jgi:hypothetical protein
MMALRASVVKEEMTDESAGFHGNWGYYFTTSPKLRYETWTQACIFHVFTPFTKKKKKLEKIEFLWTVACIP